MKRRLLCLVLAAALAALTGCSLARPVREDAGADRWVGYYMVYQSQEEFTADPVSRRLSQEIVWGDWDEESRTLTFPKLTGSALLVLGREGDRITVPSVTEMSPGPVENAVSSTEEGDSYTVSGTVWWGAPLDAPADFDPLEDGGFWFSYPVYRTPAGAFYLDAHVTPCSYGSGGGPFRQGEYAYRDDGGKLRTDTLSMTVATRYAPRLTALRVAAFDKGNQLLGTTGLPLSEELSAVTVPTEAAWVAVEEESADGVKHTSYDLSQEGTALHQVILLDEDGRGWGVDLTIRR